jgi:hypothetical protein
MPKDGAVSLEKIFGTARGPKRSHSFPYVFALMQHQVERKEECCVHRFAVDIGRVELSLWREGARVAAHENTGQLRWSNHVVYGKLVRPAKRDAGIVLGEAGSEILPRAEKVLLRISLAAGVAVEVSQVSGRT